VQEKKKKRDKGHHAVVGYGIKVEKQVIGQCRSRESLSEKKQSCKAKNEKKEG